MAMNPRFPNIPGIALVGFALTVSCPAFSATVGAAAPASETEPAKQAPAPQPAAPQPNEVTTDDYTQDARVLGELSRRKDALDRREHELELREARISAAELLARREVGQLSTLRGEVEEIVKQQTNDASADLATLAALFSSMKPSQAAAILGKLEIPKAAAILRRLQTQMAGPVLAAMDPTVAAGVTQELERAHAPFQD
jgi:flagellar motility protein MotE (MotC chaperone)